MEDLSPFFITLLKIFLFFKVIVQPIFACFGVMTFNVKEYIKQEIKKNTKTCKNGIKSGLEIAERRVNRQENVKKN